MKNWSLILKSDLVKIGTTEDGEDVVRELWYVVAVDAAGRRFRDGRSFEREEAEERLALFVLDGGVDGEASWSEMYPVYGSAAYQDQEPLLVAAERQEAMADTKRTIGMRYDAKNRVMA
jgi:hypothetical protein